ncbi:hypothetical protein LCGC14_0610800 [marine sediment metagenome]|uniref:Uncharacterized protein n=1 Tax=marine sediment metagenome TaxID=412755 RepID=A0A0F9R7U6_9ZZZZ
MLIPANLDSILIQCIKSPVSNIFYIYIGYFTIEPPSISIEELNLNNLFIYFSLENLDYMGSSIDPYTIDYYEFDKKLSISQNW